MIIDVIPFIILAAIAITAALAMVTSRNAVHAALFLVINFGAIATFYVVLNAPFLAMVQVAVYAGAIMVLFLFVIMLLGAERLGGSSKLRWQQTRERLQAQVRRRHERIGIAIQEAQSHDDVYERLTRIHTQVR